MLEASGSPLWWTPFAHAHGRECAIAIFKMMLQPSVARGARRLSSQHQPESATFKESVR
jgi:hypothetical protein